MAFSPHSAIGPELVMPSVYLREIWGTEDGSGPGIGIAMSSLSILWSCSQSIGTRLRHAGTPMHRIGSTSISSAMRHLGQGWAQGFVTGMHLCGQAWDQLVEADGVGELALHILALALDSSSVLPGRYAQRHLSTTCRALSKRLPPIGVTGQLLLPARHRSRQRKTGRNEPCPCGSGKKYKKCCGMSGPPTFH